MGFKLTRMDGNSKTSLYMIIFPYSSPQTDELTLHCGVADQLGVQHVIYFIYLN